MKKGTILSLIIVSLLVSVVSAEIILNEQPKGIYNLGETISFPVIIKSNTDALAKFQMDLICGEVEKNVYSQGPISLLAGAEKEIDFSVPFIREIIGTSKGLCKIRCSLDNVSKAGSLSDKSLTNEFKISELVNVKASLNKNKLNPEEEVIITGNATKESGEELEGFVDITLSKDNFLVIRQTETVVNGLFNSEIKLQKTMESGEYVLTITAYEKDSQERVTNKGFLDNSITVNQIPTSLEIIFEKKEVIPGEILRTKAVLHDQTGKKINSLAVITIKNEENSVISQVEKQTDQFVEYQIKEGQAPSEWKVAAVSSQLSKESSFKIDKLEKVDIDLINKTVLITNTGNVFYNKTLLITIGSNQSTLDISLKIGESKKYYLTAPTGEYQVKVISQEGKEITESVALTGSAISIKEISEGATELIRHPFVWFFITAILGFAAFLFFKKGYKKSFFGYGNSRPPKPLQIQERAPSQKNVLVFPKNKAHLSMSIKGNQQKTSVVCLRIKNHQNLVANKSGTAETLQKIVNMAEDAKASIYENNEIILFLFIPSITKTFQNELTSADFAQSAKKILNEHNKLFKQKISYGLSAEVGDIISKPVEDSIAFMGMGQLLINAKKLASIAQEDVFIGENLKEKIQSDAKLEKHASERLPYYTIKELRDKEKHQKFLSSFVKRMEKDKNPTKDFGKKDSVKPKEEIPSDDDGLDF